jgi:hypothetical protein
MEMSGQNYAPAVLSLEDNLSSHWIVNWIGSRVSIPFWRIDKAFAPKRVRTLDRPARGLINILSHWSRVMGGRLVWNGVTG